MIVVETVPPVVYVMGEVANPGRGSAERPDVGAAGAGHGRRLPRFREHEGHPRAAAQRRAGVQTIAFNYKSAVKGDGNPVLLQPGDTVIVP